MSDTAVENAKALRDTLAAKINKLQQELEETKKEILRVDRFLSDWAEFAATPVVVSSVPFSDRSFEFGVPVDKQDSPAPKSRKNPDKKAVADSAESILVANGHPMSRTELYKALVNIGIVLEGKDPEMVLSTMLWRSQDRIIRLPGLGYWVKSKAYPPGGYNPPDVFD